MLLNAVVLFLSFLCSSCTTCEKGENGWFRDPQVCSNYYRCVDGILYPGKCAPGLMFNSETLQCDWPSNVECSLSMFPRHPTLPYQLICLLLSLLENGTGGPVLVEGKRA